MLRKARNLVLMMVVQCAGFGTPDMHMVTSEGFQAEQQQHPGRTAAAPSRGVVVIGVLKWAASKAAAGAGAGGPTGLPA
jgi:hypothetical protein